MNENESVTLADALKRAVELLRNEQIEEADELLALIADVEPDHPDVLHFLGVLRHAQDRNDEGIALIRESLERAPDQAGAWNNLGNLLLHAHRLDEAIDAYEASVVHGGATDASADALNNISTMQRRRGDPIAAEEAARRAIELRPEFGNAWYNLSLSLMGQRRVAEGMLANSKAIALWPRETQSRSQVVHALVLLGEHEQAAMLYREWLVEEPDNPVVQHMLAASEGTTLPRASDAYVQTVFDAYADSFDASLERLHYRAPALVANELERVVGAPHGELSIADAGCGTGLCGPLLRPWAARLAGCDLSVGMLRRARPRGCYDVLHQSELVYYLVTQPGAFDVVVSADTLCYFGDLNEACAASARSLKANGWLIFTVEALADDDPESMLSGVKLQPTGRYTHSRAHLAQALRAAGFDSISIAPAVSRSEGGREVAGWLASARVGAGAGAKTTKSSES